ncbi:GNAT family N-acetyltransferase [Bacillus sp. ISL-47]|uniref:GNAT family N-acetyltransferase n=1 Tax=Bacillus sp. ISL-47 TaxID=2819130 RepID=UPI001BE56EBE|nr:GNAT family N-acetyltransferase [Bacillus sp. ISL-47]MBT2687873.1 GNAT family N-acetyltransferase [Bacillus sp. ISL-47]MBT2708050.1 GNAT family N-acetyltransferase [Pseudomonas sp. ISL-84]
MEIGNLTSNLLTDSDWPFFLKIIKTSPEWEETEKSGFNLKKYVALHEKLNGEWRLWRLDGEQIAVTFHVNKSPSNQKPWIGTILVKEERRRQGLGIAIIGKIGEELKSSGEKSLFAGVPEYRYKWIEFLSDAGFEQFKMETSPEGKDYLIMVCPLI